MPVNAWDVAMNVVFGPLGTAATAYKLKQEAKEADAKASLKANKSQARLAEAEANAASKSNKSEAEKLKAEASLEKARKEAELAEAEKLKASSRLESVKSQYETTISDSGVSETTLAGINLIFPVLAGGVGFFAGGLKGAIIGGILGYGASNIDISGKTDVGNK